MKRILLPLLFLALSSCEGEEVPPSNEEDGESGGGASGAEGPLTGRAQALGDSVLAWNAYSGESIPDAIEAVTGLAVSNDAVPGATMSVGGDESIPGQYRSEEWDWVIVEGGANDLLGLCDCGDCDDVLDDIITADLKTGALPPLVEEVKGDGAQVMILGYYRVEEDTEFGPCEDEMDSLEQRFQALAKSEAGVHYFSMDEAMDPVADPSLLGADRVHPSPEGSRMAGEAIGREILSLSE